MRLSSTQLSPGLAAAVAALALAGCSATHVGESWQCPLAQGSSCTSIAEADPAVSASAARAAALFGEPLPEARHQIGSGAGGGRYVHGGACDDDCGFFAWFKTLFGGDTDAHLPRPKPEAAATTAKTEQTAAPAPAADASLRVPEVLGRIWIAPFVDADGIYREAHWVRVVLEPAGWKLP